MRKHGTAWLWILLPPLNTTTLPSTKGSLGREEVHLHKTWVTEKPLSFCELAHAYRITSPTSQEGGREGEADTSREA